MKDGKNKDRMCAYHPKRGMYTVFSPLSVCRRLEVSFSKHRLRQDACEGNRRILYGERLVKHEGC